MSAPEPRRRTDMSEAVWAHNRWPTIGLYTGAGIGLLMGFTFVAGWWWTILYVVGLALGGMLLGWGLATFIYGPAAERARHAAQVRPPAAPPATTGSDAAAGDGGAKPVDAPEHEKRDDPPSEP